MKFILCGNNLFNVNLIESARLEKNGDIKVFSIDSGGSPYVLPFKDFSSGEKAFRAVLAHLDCSDTPFGNVLNLNN